MFDLDMDNEQPMPPHGGAAPPPGPTEAEPHPLVHHVDASNAIQQELLQRASRLTGQDTDAFMRGCSPEAAAVLKKVLPEIAFLIDAVTGAGGAAPMGSVPPAAAAQMREAAAAGQPIEAETQGTGMAPAQLASTLEAASQPSSRQSPMRRQPSRLARL